MAQENVTKFMKTGKWYSSKEITKELKLARQTVTRNLRRLVEYGEVVMFRKSYHEVYYKRLRKRKDRPIDGRIPEENDITT